MLGLRSGRDEITNGYRQSWKKLLHSPRKPLRPQTIPCARIPSHFLYRVSLYRLGYLVVNCPTVLPVTCMVSPFAILLLMFYYAKSMLHSIPYPPLSIGHLYRQFLFSPLLNIPLLRIFNIRLFIYHSTPSSSAGPLVLKRHNSDSIRQWR